MDFSTVWGTIYLLIYDIYHINFIYIPIFVCKLLFVSLVAQTVKRLSTMRETRVRSLGQEDPLEKEMAAHSTILAWRIPWTEEPGGLQSMGSQRVEHDFITEDRDTDVKNGLVDIVGGSIRWDELRE